MVRQTKRDYDEFIRLKEQESNKVTEQNATHMFEDSIVQIMNKLNRLNVKNVAEVENFYLTVAKLTQAASYVAAGKKAIRKNTSIIDEMTSIGVDDVLPVLMDAFKDHPQAMNLYKINIIDLVYQPAKQPWAGLHARMETIANATNACEKKASELLPGLKVTTSAYKEHLENKLKANGVDIPLANDISEETPAIIKRMIFRYQAVLELEKLIENKATLTAKHIYLAQEQVKKCIDNKPEWLERPFLQILTDIMSLGIIPLYRAFNSKENDLQETMQQSFNSPKIS